MFLTSFCVVMAIRSVVDSAEQDRSSDTTGRGQTMGPEGEVRSVFQKSIAAFPNRRFRLHREKHGEEEDDSVAESEIEKAVTQSSSLV